MATNFLMQMQWDAALVKAWQNDWSVDNLVGIFRKQRGISWAIFNRIERTPDLVQFHMPVRAFVAAGLPILSERLWAGNMQDCDIVLWLGDSCVRTGRPKRGMFTLIKKQVKSDKRTKRVDINAGHRRSDWNVCK